MKHREGTVELFLLSGFVTSMLLSAPLVADDNADQFSYDHSE
jgi:hypothetical protein